MRTTEVIRQLQEMVKRRGDRQFVVIGTVAGKPVCAFPHVGITARGPHAYDSDAEGATLGFDIYLDGVMAGQMVDGKITIRVDGGGA